MVLYCDKMPHHVHTYAEDIAEGRIPASRATRWACERHLRDLDTGKDRGLVWSDAAADRVLAFFRLARHYEGRWAGKEVVLEPWQRWMIGSAWGWLREDGTRRYRRVYREIPRKSGKTLLIAVEGHYGLVGDGEEGAQVWTAASTRDQCGPVFRAAWAVRSSSPDLRQAERTVPQKPVLDSIDTRSRILFDPLRAFWGTLARDSEKVDGLNPHLALVDEVHVHRDGSVIDTLRSGMGARSQPMLLMITSAGLSPVGFGRQMHDDMLALLDPDSGAEDDATMVAIWGVDDEDDPFEDEECWAKASPNLGVSVSRDYLREEVTAARNEGGAKRREVEAKHFNRWSRTAGDAAIMTSHWDSCRGRAEWKTPKDAEHWMRTELVGCGGAAGLDLAQTQDMVATVLAIPYGDHVYWLPRFFTPTDSLSERQSRDRVPYDRWIEQGWLIPHAGAVIDLDDVEQTLFRDAERYGVRTLAYDPWTAEQMAQHAATAGLEVVKMSQGFAGMAGPTVTTLDLIRKGKIVHGGHPILAWNAACAITQTHPGTGAVRLVREDAKRGRRIDGLAAAVMATGRLALDPGQRESVYERPEWSGEDSQTEAPTAEPPTYVRRSVYEQEGW